MDLPQRGQFVFPGARGRRLNYEYFHGRFWRPAIKAAGLRFRIHDLRHAFASLLLAFGETVLYVSRQLGHSSAKLTLDTYGHLLEEGHRLDREATLGKLEGVLRGATRVLLKPAGAEETISETRMNTGAADRIRTG